MFKGFFGQKKGPAPPSKPRLSRVNLKRRFTLLATIGNGSMSHVHRAMDNDTGRSVCLKLQIQAKQAAAVARANLKDRPPEGEIGLKIVHPHVVKTLEHGLTTKGDYFIVMEFIEGFSLQALREARSLTLPGKLDLLAQAAEALAAVHAQKFIHHDVGPKNFLVTREYQVKLIDFGLAIPNTPAFQRPGNRTGTLQYMAPELVRRETIDERIDIFSFGVMAFELLTDTLPYDATGSMEMMLQRINQPPRDPAEANPELPEEICAILRKALARRKEDRWPKMSILAEELRKVIPEDKPSAR